MMGKYAFRLKNEIKTPNDVKKNAGAIYYSNSSAKTNVGTIMINIAIPTIAKADIIPNTYTYRRNVHLNIDLLCAEIISNIGLDRVLHHSQTPITAKNGKITSKHKYPIFIRSPAIYAKTDRITTKAAEIQKILLLTIFCSYLIA